MPKLIQKDKINSIYQWCICTHHISNHYLGYGKCEQCLLIHKDCKSFHLDLKFKVKIRMNFEDTLKFLHIPYPIVNDKLRLRLLKQYLKGDLI